MTLEELKQQLKETDSLKGAQKLSATQALFASLTAFEKSVIKNPYSVTLYEIQEMKKFIPAVQAQLSRLEAGEKRRLQREMEREAAEK